MFLPIMSLMVVLNGDLASEEIKRMQGTWKITAMFENGESVSARDISRDFSANGQISVSGPIITFRDPGTLMQRTVAFTINPNVEPKHLDLVGLDKLSSRAIYMFTGDSLMIAFTTARRDERPTDFTSGSPLGRILIILKRETTTPHDFKDPPPSESRAVPPAPPSVTINIDTGGASVQPTPPATPPATPAITTVASAPANLPALQPVPEAPSADDRMRSMLMGTWGHQSDESINYVTLNPDGSFSSIINWKKGFKKMFEPDVRSSGTWTVENGVVILRITTSTDKKVMGQVYSARITHLGPSDLVAVDNAGRTRREWRVR